uniref:Uncharacterized protein n=1 Tax=Anguilla anguilla TaxID=7936 RepID=A0A0E9Q1R5_ANGAN
MLGLHSLKSHTSFRNCHCPQFCCLVRTPQPIIMHKAMGPSSAVFPAC